MWVGAIGTESTEAELAESRNLGLLGEAIERGATQWRTPECVRPTAVGITYLLNPCVGYIICCQIY